MASSSSSLLLFLLSITTVHSLSPATTTHIHRACNHTRYSDLCVRLLLSDPHSLSADGHGLAAIALRLAAASAAETSSFISTLLQAGGDEPSLQQCLADCTDSYVDAVDQLDHSQAALGVGAYRDVATWVTAAMSDAGTCSEGCKRVPGSSSLILASRNEDFEKTCSITSALATLLSSHSQ